MATRQLQLLTLSNLTELSISLTSCIALLRVASKASPQETASLIACLCSAAIISASKDALLNVWLAVKCLIQGELHVCVLSLTSAQ